MVNNIRCQRFNNASCVNQQQVLLLIFFTTCYYILTTRVNLFAFEQKFQWLFKISVCLIRNFPRKIPHRAFPTNIWGNLYVFLQIVLRFLWKYIFRHNHQDSIKSNAVFRIFPNLPTVHGYWFCWKGEQRRNVSHVFEVGMFHLHNEVTTHLK